MKNRKKVFIQDNKPVVVIKNKKYDDAFDGLVKVAIGKNIANYNSFINCIYVSRELFESIGSVAVLYNDSTKEYQDVFCHVEEEELKGNQIRATATLLNNIKYEEDDELFLLKYNHASFNDIKIQRIDNIKEDYVVLSKKTLDNIFPNFGSTKYRLFVLYNSVTGENLVVKKKHIIIDDSLKEGVIRISRILRLFLGLETRDYIPDLAWKSLNKESK